jgi:hypothetical protein
VWWLKSEISPNLPASSPVTTSGSAVSSTDTGAEHEGVTAVEGDGWLEVDGSRRVRHVISGEIPYLARQLSVF